jgi:uncharacterized protein YecT (DUF1311 family)
MCITRQRAAAVALGLIFGAWIGTAQAAPAAGACGHPSTLRTLSDAVQRNIPGTMAGPDDIKAVEGAIAQGALKMTFQAVRTVARDPSVGRSLCGAAMRLTIHRETLGWLARDILTASVVARQGWRRDGQAHALLRDVTYTSQLTDDGTQVVVEMEDARAVAGSVGLVAVAAWLGANKGPAPAPGATDGAERDAAPAPVVADGICAGLEAATTAGAMDCQGRHFKQADDALNANYRSAMARLPADRKAALRKEQRAWLAVRDSGCAAEIEARGLGGTAAGLEIAGCVTGKTRARAAELEAYR